MKRYRTKNVFRLVHVALICIGFLASHLTAALHIGAAARKIGDGTAGGTSSVCSAGGNELPMAAIRPSTAVESAPLLNNTLPRDVALSGAVASCEALAGVFAAISVRNTNQDLPFRHSLVTRHVRLQI